MAYETSFEVSWSPIHGVSDFSSFETLKILGVFITNEISFTGKRHEYNMEIVRYFPSHFIAIAPVV